MKLCGIVTEFNPLTNGHSYFISEAKRLSGADVVSVMSGNFSQRGELTILDKYQRAKLAINHGVSLVFELPACFSLSAAPYFASGAVRILADIGITDLAFGVKIKDTNNLIKVAKIKANESREISELIKTLMKAGLTYNKALYQTYKKFCPELGSALEEIFIEPNNILAVEYLSTIYSHNLNIKPIFIDRTDYGYSSPLSATAKINGKRVKMINATFIRSKILSGKTWQIKKYVPSDTYEELAKINKDNLLNAEERLTAVLLSSLRQKKPSDLIKIADYNTDLSHQILEKSRLHSSRAEICEVLASKSYRKARINKLILTPYLNITKDFEDLLDKKYAINVLAVDKTKRQLISDVIKSAKIRLVVSSKDKNFLSDDERTFVDLADNTSNLYQVALKTEAAADKTIFV